MDMLALLYDYILNNNAFIIPVMAIFARMSVFIFLLPGIGETMISARTRLVVAIALTWLLVPLIIPTLNISETLSVTEAVILLSKEAFYGFVLGFSFRLMMFVLQILGNIISQAMSISQVLGEGITTEPNTTIASLLMLGGAALLVTMNLHIEAVGVFYRSYEAFPFGTFPDGGNLAAVMLRKCMEMFTFGVSLALPFIIINFVYNLMLGFLNRAMPQLMVSFVGMPAVIFAGMVLLVVTAGNMLMYWAQSYADVSMALPVLTNGGTTP